MRCQPIIGLEVHIQLKTESKMFCGCPNEPFGREPNTLTCPTCLGLPGALPVPNKKAIENTVLLGLALNGQINRESYFERKNYFYPDLPKGYQISQYRQPLCHDGGLEVGAKADPPGVQHTRRVRIRRVHLEEDTGKMIHQSGTSLIDFNRSGVPLVEVVSEPDFSSVEEVDTYLKELQRIVRYLGISGADMEKGSMRLEPTVNLKISRDGKDYYTPLAEIKNINSFRFVKKALAFEINRQQKTFQETGEEKQAGNKRTVGFSEDRGETFLQREKEEAHDYRYFPEPDIPPLVVDGAWLAGIRKRLPELPAQKRERFEKDYEDLRAYQVSLLTDTQEKADYFEGLVRKALPVKEAANLVINRPDTLKVAVEDTVKIYEKLKVEVVSDGVQLHNWAKAVITDNPAAVQEFRRGKKETLQFLMGQVMEKSKGRAEPKMVKKILEEQLKA